MEALGLTKMASGLIGSSRDPNKHKGKSKIVEEDEDHTPIIMMNAPMTMTRMVSRNIWEKIFWGS